MSEITFEVEPLSWPEAEEAFRRRLNLPADLYYELEERYRGLGFTIRHVATMQTLARIRRRLEQMIANGEPLDAFISWAGRQAFGWTDAYTELVFRMASISASSQGRWEQITDTDLGDEFPYWMYDAVDDDRTRSTHAAMDGKAWPKDQFPDHWVPPNGYQCRCDIRQLNDDLMRRSGAELQDTGPDDDPDEGFQANQARAGALREELEEQLRQVQSRVQQ